MSFSAERFDWGQREPIDEWTVHQKVENMIDDFLTQKQRKEENVKEICRQCAKLSNKVTFVTCEMFMTWINNIPFNFLHRNCPILLLGNVQITTNILILYYPFGGNVYVKRKVFAETLFSSHFCIFRLDGHLIESSPTQFTLFSFPWKIHQITQLNRIPLGPGQLFKCSKKVKLKVYENISDLINHRHPHLL